jgi:hypothetical protein
MDTGWLISLTSLRQANNRVFNHSVHLSSSRGRVSRSFPTPLKEGSEEMLRTAGKVLKSIFLSGWGRGRVTNLLTVVVALILATVTPAIAANGDNFHLGKGNLATAVTRLTGTVAGPALQVYNPSTSVGATAAFFRVATGHPPFTVNSSTKVADLNSDKLDGQDSSAFLPVNGTAANADKVDGQDAEALKPLLADVEGNGNLDTLANIRGVVSVEKLGTGLYEVTFDRDVHNCVRVGGVGASLNSSYFPDPGFIANQQVDGQVSTFNSTRGDAQIGVLTNAPNGTRADRSFQLAVYC